MTAAALGAQSPAPPLAFEVATVKPSGPTGQGVRGGCHGIDSTFAPGPEIAPPPLGRCVIFDARLGHLISIAFGIRNMQWIRSSPDWVVTGFDRFNVEAKAEDPSHTTQAQLLAMLQALLIERFQMKFHREEIETPGFAIVVGKNGPKFKPSKSDKESTKFEMSAEGKGVTTGKPMLGQPTTWIAQRYSMATLARLLTQMGQLGPVSDKTGLDGVYDFRLSWDDNAGPALGSAIQDQLGLRLEKQKVPVTHFIVDSAKKPSGD